MKYHELLPEMGTVKSLGDGVDIKDLHQNYTQFCGISYYKWMVIKYAWVRRGNKAKAMAHFNISSEMDPKVMLQGRERHIVKLRQNYGIIELFKLLLQRTNLNFCQQNIIFVPVKPIHAHQSFIQKQVCPNCSFKSKYGQNTCCHSLFYLSHMQLQYIPVKDHRLYVSAFYFSKYLEHFKTHIIFLYLNI